MSSLPFGSTVSIMKFLLGFLAVLILVGTVRPQQEVLCSLRKSDMRKSVNCLMYSMNRQTKNAFLRVEACSDATMFEYVEAKCTDQHRRLQARWEACERQVMIPENIDFDEDRLINCFS